MEISNSFCGFYHALLIEALDFGFNRRHLVVVYAFVGVAYDFFFYGLGHVAVLGPAQPLRLFFGDACADMPLDYVDYGLG